MASLVAQLVKNLPAMHETCVQSLGWEDPLEKGTAAHSSILAWRIPWTVVYGVTKSETRLSDLHFQLSLGHRTRHWVFSTPRWLQSPSECENPWAQQRHWLPRRRLKLSSTRGPAPPRFTPTLPTCRAAESRDIYFHSHSRTCSSKTAASVGVYFFAMLF